MAPKSDAESNPIIINQTDNCSTRNVKLLSFGADEDEGGQEPSIKKKAIFRPDREYTTSRHVV